MRITASGVVRHAGCAVLVLTALAFVPSSVTTATAVHAPLMTIAPGASSTAGATSTNWAGYVSTTGPFTSVSATWVQPKGTCTSTPTYGAFWVGLDGDGSNSVEQTGSEVDCFGGVPHYYSWYEMYPKYPVNFPLPVHPGDVFHGSVVAATGGAFTLVLTDLTGGWTRTVHATYAPAKLHSAEIIAEAPSSASRVLPLTDFHGVLFSSAKANGKAIGSDSPVSINMESGSTLKAATSLLSNGQNFEVVWKHV
jgi:Peptidase A4 family